MTIDEVIQEYKEEAEEQRKVAKSLNAEEHLFYAEKNKQIAEWLEELKALRQNKKCIPFATIQFDKNYLQKIVDEKLKSIELDIQAIRNKTVDDFAGKLKTEYKYALSIQAIEKETAYFAIDKVAEQMKGEKI